MDAIEYGELSKAQGAKFHAYYDLEYCALYPAPVLKVTGLDWKFYGLSITAGATVIVAALRTAQMFYFAEEMSSKFWTKTENGSPLLGWLGAFFSMLAFEGGLAFISAVKTAEKESIDERVYTWQIGLLLTISVFAGFGQSLGLIQGIDPEFVKYFSYFLVFIVGVGASFAAWFSGEILGVQLQKFSELKKQAEVEFSEQKSRHISQARKKFLEKWEEEKREKKLLSEPAEEKLEKYVRNPVLSSQRSTENRNSPSQKAKIIWGEMAEAYENRNGEILSFSELKAVLQEKYPTENFTTDSLISKNRNIWIEKQKEFLEKPGEN